MKKHYLSHYLLIIFFSSLLLIPFLGNVHLFDWDEINFAESAREMLLTNDFSKVQINFEPFWEKPPLFIWLQALSMKIFGVNEFAARFPNAFFGIINLCFIYFIGIKFFKGRIGMWWVLSYMAAIFPGLYFKTGLIDPVFNLFIFTSIYQLFLVYQKYKTEFNSNINVFYSALFIGLAILTKGPVAVLIWLLVALIVFVFRGFQFFFSLKQVVLFILVSIFVTSLWIIPESMKNGFWFVKEFINYQIGLFSQNIAGHQQPWYYHTLILFFGCFPASVFAIYGMKKNDMFTFQENTFRLFMLATFWVVLILFSIVKTKIIHYSSMCWLPLTFLSAYGIESIVKRQFKFKWYAKFWIILFLIILILMTFLFPFILSNPEYKANLIFKVTDTFSKGNLSVPLSFDWLDYIPSVIIMLTLLIFIVKLKSKFLSIFYLKVGFILFIFVTSILFIPKIEQISQNSAIGFLKVIGKKDNYIFNIGYKSYAPYFYGNAKQLKTNDGLYNVNREFYKTKNVSKFTDLSEKERNDLDDFQKNWFYKGNIDKDVYFIAKNNRQEDLPEQKNLKKMYERGGFVFYVRYKETK